MDLKSKQTAQYNELEYAHFDVSDEFSMSRPEPCEHTLNKLTFLVFEYHGNKVCVLHDCDCGKQVVETFTFDGIKEL